MSIDVPTLFEQPPLSPTVVTNSAVKRVHDNADPLWLENALTAVRYCATTHREFTTDDVWAYLISIGQDKQREPRALGAVMRQAKTLGIIEVTDRTRVSERVVCHQNPKRVWRSPTVEFFIQPTKGLSSEKVHD